MDNIPNQIECAYCKRNDRHGGECQSQKHDITGCTAFKMDDRGCIKQRLSVLPFKLYMDIPSINEWSDNWTHNGIDTEIRITNIRGLEWDIRNGYLNVLCNYEYFENEYRKDYKETNKNIFKIVK